MPITCRLCLSEACIPYASLDREYLRCQVCDLVMVSEKDLPSSERERREYLLHENEPGDVRYRRFLDQLVIPLTEGAYASKSSSALDFGSGHTAVLATMLAERGFRCDVYDPFFAPGVGALERTYDLIAGSEVVEHFHRPRRDFDLLASLLRPGGILGIMTQLRPADHEFAEWHYRRDITHVAFYSHRTLAWLSIHYEWTMDSPSPRVHLFRRSQRPPIS